MPPMRSDADTLGAPAVRLAAHDCRPGANCQRTNRGVSDRPVAGSGGNRSGVYGGVGLPRSRRAYGPEMWPLRWNELLWCSF
jgi:hypothetical protein